MTSPEPTFDPTRAELERLLDIAGETAARQILAEVGRPAAQVEFERVAALRLAIRMREAQEPRHVIRDRLALRGLSRATAYRVIGRAISVPPANCLTGEALVRRGPDTVQPFIDLDTRPQPQEPTTIMSTAMPDATATQELAENPLGALNTPCANVDALVARRDDLRARLRSIDLASAERRLEEAKAKRDASPGDVSPTFPPSAGSSPEMNQRRIAYEEAATEFKAAQGSLRSLREEALAISNELVHLRTMLEAESRVDAARATAQEAEQQAGLCKDAVVKADAAMKHVDGLIEEEECAYQAARDEVGARVLEAVKSGGTVPVKAASRDKVATLEVAKRGAEQELQAARAALQQAEQRRRYAWQQVRLAESSVAERAFLQSEREYVEALARVLVAKSLARDPFGAIDPREEAIERSRRIVEALGA